MKNGKGSRLSLLTVLIIGIMVGFQLGRASAGSPFVISLPVGSPGQTITESLPQVQPDPATESTQPAEESEAADAWETHASPEGSGTDQSDLSEDGKYNSKDDVARYIRIYGHLPSNYVTKKAARDAGWSGGSLEYCFPGCSIGGDVFRNREGTLPKASGRTYYECDIDSAGKRSRGSKRIVYSNDGLIYYTDDHYNTFTLLYGKTD